MTDNQIKIIDIIKSNFPNSILLEEDFREDLTITVETAKIHDICKFLKESPELRFEQSIDVTIIDWATRKNRFAVVYVLLSLTYNERIRVKAAVNDNGHHPTVSDIWMGASWQEREAYDMYGIIFDGHPDLRRMYLPEEVDFHPLRKDYPLMGHKGDMKLPEIIED